MPEGPEVHRAARRIGKALEGQTLTHVGFGFERLRPWERQLEGATTTRVEKGTVATAVRGGGAPAAAGGGSAGIVTSRDTSACRRHGSPANR